MVKQVGDSITLPSQGIYNQFKESAECHVTQGGKVKSKDDIVGIVKIAWGLRGIKGKMVTEIVNAWCRTRNITVEVTDKYGPCNFLYYWIGHRIKGNIDHNDFREAMKIIYSKLRESPLGTECRNLYSDISETFFGWAKDLFDYNYNREDVIQKKECSQYLDSGVYYEHVAKAKEAYDKLCEKCGEITDDSYCQEFIREHGTGIHCKLAWPPALICPTASAPRALSPEKARMEPTSEVVQKQVMLMPQELVLHLGFRVYVWVMVS
ncbi:hypothetical protein PCYB_002120 [Plasmodium cynomolgi strain B]|uniref:KIR-like CYIR protein n=1 Tax=Plasmodium cynomolgi (strain B) TaxID=1120755 RepID=K6UNG4_PLACD|nr:hypothetical protein PCYB_002120 [Plasmodium cynomolgi strain B]GAB69463.1 hypothetical protein PCYB_002120 [Plasmodium cynomolgi strain B]